MAHNTLYQQQRQSMKHSLSKSYTLKWEFKDSPEYKVTTCKKIINVKSGKMLKKSYNSGSIGFWISGKWVNIKKVKSEIILIEKAECPF